VQNINSIVLLGAGNVAFHLGKAFHALGKSILQVYSRSEESASHLAQLINADHTNNIGELNLDADLYVMAVSDDAIPFVSEKLYLEDKLVVHTSGSVGMDVLADSSRNYGVFYPLQTFSKSKNPDFKSIPICLEANNKSNLELLKILGKELSNHLQIINSEQRKAIHLAAVFACNFPNLMYTAAEVFLKKKNLSFEILKPLIKETADKVQHILPSQAQTGPAYRNDIKIKNQQIGMRADNIYLMLSRNIKKIKENEQL